MNEPQQDAQAPGRRGPIADLLLGVAASVALIALMQAQLVAGNVAFLLAAIFAAVVGPLLCRMPAWAAFGFLLPGLVTTFVGPFAHLVIWIWVLLAILFGVCAWAARLIARRFWP